MSPHGQEHVSSLVHDLVEMAEATRRLPELERELADSRETARRDGDTIARLEIKLQQRNGEISDLQAKLRSVEAERDDAGFRQLEAEDKVNGLRRAVTDALATLGQAFAVIDGDGKDILYRVSSAELSEWQASQYDKKEARRQAEEAARPTPVLPSETGTGTESEASSSEGGAPIPGNGNGDPGQSAMDPTSVPTPISNESPEVTTGSTAAVAAESTSIESPEVTPAPRPISELPQAAPDSSVSEQAGASTAEPLKPVSPPEQLGKYSGRVYKDWPYYVSEASWIAGGGTSESYWQGFRAAQ